MSHNFQPITVFAWMILQGIIHEKLKIGTNSSQWITYSKKFPFFSHKSLSSLFFQSIHVFQSKKVFTTLPVFLLIFKTNECKFILYCALVLEMNIILLDLKQIFSNTFDHFLQLYFYATQLRHIAFAQIHTHQTSILNNGLFCHFM